MFAESDTLIIALNFWHDAGVDVVVKETPQQWLADTPQQSLAAPPRRDAPKATNTAQAPKAAPLELPHITSLHEWREWCAHAPYLAPSGDHKRLLPQGDDDAELMILIETPQAEDMAAGVLLGGALASMFERMLAALGTSRERVFLAALSPVPRAAQTSSPALAQHLANMARMLVRLKKPKQLWLMGSAPTHAILGMSDLNAKGKLHSFALEVAEVKEENQVQVIATVHPHLLMHNPKLKAEAWLEMQRLLT
jgi:uracil-DNA glycosylase